MSLTYFERKKMVRAICSEHNICAGPGTSEVPPGHLATASGMGHNRLQVGKWGCYAYRPTDVSRNNINKPDYCAYLQEDVLMLECDEQGNFKTKELI